MRPWTLLLALGAALVFAGGCSRAPSGPKPLEWGERGAARLSRIGEKIQVLKEQALMAPPAVKSEADARIQVIEKTRDEIMAKLNEKPGSKQSQTEIDDQIGQLTTQVDDLLRQMARFRPGSGG